MSTTSDNNNTWYIQMYICIHVHTIYGQKWSYLQTHTLSSVGVMFDSDSSPSPSPSDDESLDSDELSPELLLLLHMEMAGESGRGWDCCGWGTCGLCSPARLKSSVDIARSTAI